MKSFKICFFLFSLIFFFTCQIYTKSKSTPVTISEKTNISLKDSVPLKDNSSTENYTDLNGLRQGIWREYYPNGQINAETHYKNGKLHGTSKYYNYNSRNIYLLKTFNNNQITGQINYNIDGSKTEYHFKLGELDSIYRFYFDNGQLASEGNYDNGKKIGKWRWYEKKGNLIRYADYQVFIMQTGEFNSYSVTAQSGEKWYGLLSENTTFFLKHYILQVDTVDNSMIGNKINIKTKKKIIVRDNEIPIFLFKGIKSMQDGSVKTSFNGIQYIQPEGKLELQIDQNKYEITAHADSAFIPHKYPVPYTLNYRLKITHNNQTQIIGFSKVYEECRPEIIWAGDLDNDNKLDLILNLRQSNGAAYNLLLSSYAEKGELLKIVAEFEINGC